MEPTPELFLTRAQYDALLPFEPDLADAWYRCERTWSVAGVNLTGAQMDLDLISADACLGHNVPPERL